MPDDTAEGRRRLARPRGCPCRCWRRNRGGIAGEAGDDAIGIGADGIAGRHAGQRRHAAAVGHRRAHAGPVEREADGLARDIGTRGGVSRVASESPFRRKIAVPETLLRLVVGVATVKSPVAAGGHECQVAGEAGDDASAIGPGGVAGRHSGERGDAAAVGYVAVPANAPSRVKLTVRPGSLSRCRRRERGGQVSPARREPPSL